MYKITRQSTIQTESLEEKFQRKGLLARSISYNPKSGRIFLGDAREGDGEENWLINVDKLKQAKVLGAAGKDVNSVKGIFSNLHFQMLENKRKMEALAEKYVGKDILKIGERIVGAAGPTATTDYQALRQTGDLLTQVIGTEHTNEDYQAHNIAEDVNKDSIKFEYIRRTSAVMIAQKNIADDQEAMPTKHAYTTGTKEIFALGLSLVTSIRDNIDTKADIVADFKKQVPDAFLAAKNEMVITLLNAITGTNQGDWDSFSSGIPAVNAANQIQTAENSVKAYGRPLVCIMDSTALNGYLQNLQGAYQANIDTNVAFRSRSGANAKSGVLPGNPSVTYYVDEALTAATYVLAAKSAYMKKFNAMVINTTYKNPRNAGQTEQMFWYEFFGVEETESSAAYKGTSVLT